MLATAFGGPLAGAATGAIIKALGMDAGSSPAEVAAVVANATPEQLLALKQADATFRTAMRQLDITEETLATSDRSSARGREIAVKDQTPKVLAAIVTLGFFGLLGAMVFVDVPPGTADIIKVMVGALGAGWTTMMAYYYGASASRSAPPAGAS